MTESMQNVSDEAFDVGRSLWLDRYSKTPFGEPEFSKNETERDLFLKGIWLAEAWARGADFYHRWCGFKKRNPYSKMRAGIIEPKNGSLDERLSANRQEWYWWERGYRYAWGYDDFDSKEEAEDALNGKRRKRYPIPEHWI